VPGAKIESSDRASRITIDIEPNRSGFDDRWRIRVETPDVVATHGFWSGMEPQHLAAFFEDLAQEWRGWNGDKVFAVVEHDLALRATHDGSGHVVLWVRLGTHVAADAKTWHVSVPLGLEARQLDRVADAVRLALVDS
jgi:hypothetical protein